MSKPTKKQFYFNGVHAVTGNVCFPSLSSNQLAPILRLDEEDTAYLAELRDNLTSTNIDNHADLAQAGWGVIFSYNASPALQEALTPLLELRQTQSPKQFRIFADGDGYNPDETCSEFVYRHYITAKKPLPHYLLIVGSPSEIPYKFQQHLNIQHAVGRIYFDDETAYHRYAQTVVAAETGQIRLPRHLSFFSVANPHDRASGYSTKHDSYRLYRHLKQLDSNWQVDFLARQTPKTNLSPLLGGKKTPAVLVLSGHGLIVPATNPRQQAEQGALLCQDWLGSQHDGAIPPEFYFSADDISEQASLAGSLLFHYSSYGAGTSPHRQIDGQTDQPPFVAKLPQQLLSHPQGGMLAVFSYVDRLWGGSSARHDLAAKLSEAVLAGVMAGQPIGLAFDRFDEKFIKLAHKLELGIRYTQRLQRQHPAKFDDYIEKYGTALVDLWVDYNDLKNYAIIGDPAVRVPVDSAIRLIQRFSDSAIQTIQTPQDEIRDTVVKPEKAIDAPKSPEPLDTPDVESPNRRIAESSESPELLDTSVAESQNRLESPELLDIADLSFGLSNTTEEQESAEVVEPPEPSELLDTSVVESQNRRIAESSESPESQNRLESANLSFGLSDTTDEQESAEVVESPNRRIAESPESLESPESPNRFESADLSFGLSDTTEEQESAEVVESPNRRIVESSELLDTPAVESKNRRIEESQNRLESPESPNRHESLNRPLTVGDILDYKTTKISAHFGQINYHRRYNMADELENDELMMFNGVNGSNGEYGIPPMTSEELSKFIQGEGAPDNLKELKFRHESADQETFGVKEGVDPKDISQTGWGVIFYAKDPRTDEIKEALQPLLDLRKSQAGKYFRLYEKADGLRDGESKGKFLARHGAGPGPADPDNVPYYLLIVASPEDIDYRFQYLVDVQYAVGRIHFETMQEYANYAQSVVDAETKNLKLARNVEFFSVANKGDKATALSNRHLLAPLAEQIKTRDDSWNVNLIKESEATKNKLGEILNGDTPPAFLFTGSHGMEFDMNDNRQLPHQGALLCQDWPGPKAWRGKGPIPEDFYFAGTDLSKDANLSGMISFFFACYGGGTPMHDEFSKKAFKKRKEIAPRPFLAGLPTQMLNRPKGGALAVVGHVERAWGFSFVWPGAGAQIEVFNSTLTRLLEGHPIGSAIEYFNERYAEMSSVLSDELEQIEYGQEADPYLLADLWTSNNDARDYIVIGDPAVRLPVAEANEATTERTVIEVGTGSAPASTEEAPSADSSFSSDDSDTSEQPKADESFGFFSGSDDRSEVATVDNQAQDEGEGGLVAAMKETVEKLSAKLADAVDDLTSLEVMTYVSEDLEKTNQLSVFGKKKIQKADLRAMTRIALDGDIINLVPKKETEEGTKIDQELWHTHVEMVRLAQTNRMEFVRALGEISGTLVKALRG
ncbi:C25 family cysteine peptidase [Anaerolineales bacterium HSG25]|nr:C25 family cysteine peptidase [Anaerolineales bacterium HSG25]